MATKERSSIGNLVITIVITTIVVISHQFRLLDECKEVFAKLFKIKLSIYRISDKLNWLLQRGLISRLFDAGYRPDIKRSILLIQQLWILPHFTLDPDARFQTTVKLSWTKKSIWKKAIFTLPQALDQNGTQLDRKALLPSVRERMNHCKWFIVFDNVK